MNRSRILITLSGLLIFSFFALIVIVYANQSQRIKNALHDGMKILDYVEDYRRSTGNLPEKLPSKNNLPNGRYFKVSEDNYSFYITVPIKYSRENLIYYHGPLYERSGWYFMQEKVLDDASINEIPEK